MTGLVIIVICYAVIVSAFCVWLMLQCGKILEEMEDLKRELKD